MRGVMTSSEQTVDFADRFYLALLSLYPHRFQARLGRETLQIFRDCCRTKATFRQRLSCGLHTIPDVALSIPREWRREAAQEDCEIDYTGMMDLFMVSVVAGANLIGWGWTGTSWALETIGYRPSATLLTGLLTLALAALFGVLSVLFFERTSRTECTRIKV